MSMLPRNQTVAGSHRHAPLFPPNNVVPVNPARLTETGFYRLKEDGYFWLNETALVVSTPSGDARVLEAGGNYRLKEDGSFFLLDATTVLGGGGGGGGGAYTLRNIPMDSAPGTTGSSWPNQAGATYSSGSVTITGKTLTSTVTCSGANLTISDCKASFATGTWMVQITSGTCTVINCFFDGTNQTVDMRAIMHTGGTCLIKLNEFYKLCNSITWAGSGGGVCKFNYVHGPSTTSGSHADAFEIYGIGAPLEVSYNVLDIRDSAGMTACLNMVPYSTFNIPANYLVCNYNSMTGGSYVWYAQNQGSGVCTGITLTNNQIISSWAGDSGSYVNGPYTYGGIFGPGQNGLESARISVWSNNTLDGVAVSLN